MASLSASRGAAISAWRKSVRKGGAGSACAGLADDAAISSSEVTRCMACLRMASYRCACAPLEMSVSIGDLEMNRDGVLGRTQTLFSQTRVSKSNLGGWSGPRGLKLANLDGAVTGRSVANGRGGRTKV